MKLPTLFVTTLILCIVYLCVAPLPLIGQNPSRSVNLTKPDCQSCRWQFREPVPVGKLLKIDTVWFGRVAGAALSRNADVLFVSDILRHQVHKLDLRAGTSLAIGRTGDGPGEFQVPTAVAAASDGGFWVYDAQLRRLSRFRHDATFVTSFTPDFPISGIVSLAVDPSGNLIIAGSALGSERSDFLLHRFSPQGNYLSSFGRVAAERSDDPRSLGGYVVFDQTSGTLWFSRIGPKLKLEQYSLDGRFLTEINGTAYVGSDRPTQRLVQTGSQVRAVPQRRLGAIGVFAFSDNLLLNFAAVDDNGTIEFNLFDAVRMQWIARWRDKGPTPGATDQRGAIYALDPLSEPFIVRWNIQR